MAAWRRPPREQRAAATVPTCDGYSASNVTLLASRRLAPTKFTGNLALQAFGKVNSVFGKSTQLLLSQQTTKRPTQQSNSASAQSADNSAVNNKASKQQSVVSSTVSSRQSALSCWSRSTQLLDGQISCWTINSAAGNGQLSFDHDRIQESEDSMQAQHIIIEALVEEKYGLLQTIQGLQEANGAPAPFDDECEEEPEEQPKEEEIEDIPFGEGEIDDE
ncbi:hypothetical protein F511_32495 [Dorcoceras hygrometricum]|uniref:Uncharacterized protein n=1 Tax=Dorcoceras hygrometricum TaxID=472368 RepID=A0A2Z7D588_9LAMI|nr:hypothetical protein F511_32495 [Dorcoceras hygrometricum]